MDALCHWVELKAHIIGNESAQSARRWLRIFPDTSAVINYTPINEFFANMVQQILQMDANGSNHKRTVVSIAARQGSASQLRLLAQEGGDLWADLASMPLPSFMQLDALQFLIDVQGLDLTSLFTVSSNRPLRLLTLSGNEGAACRAPSTPARHQNATIGAVVQSWHTDQCPRRGMPFSLLFLCSSSVGQLGNTALMRYCSGPTAHFFEHTVEDLLQHPGINTTIANQASALTPLPYLADPDLLQKGQDALQLAQHQGNRELVSMLISHQAKHCEDEGMLA